MNKIGSLLLISWFALCVNAQIGINSYHDGYWGDWKTRTFYKISRGNYDGFAIYESGDHPSKFIMRFSINNYNPPSKEEIRKHYKDDLWFEYDGTVEYYVTEKYPTILAILREYEFPRLNSESGSAGNPCVLRRAKAKISIAPYRKRPKVYNFHFDGCAIAISMRDYYYK